MHQSVDPSQWVFVIDTDAYAGNFEREMVAYCTGEVGDCGVGKESAELYRNQLGLEEYEGSFADNGTGPCVMRRADDHGCDRPAACWPNPNWVNDGVGNHYRVADWDPAKILPKYRQHQIDYAEQHRNSYADKEAGNKEADRKIAEAKALTASDMQAFPAYKSVAIFFSDRPTDEQIVLLKERVQKMITDDWGVGMTEYAPVPKIEGFRLVQETVTLKEEPV